MYYNIHYPDGTVKRHKSYHEDKCLPVLGGAFYNLRDHRNCYCLFIITEMGEEDIWVEKASDREYICAPFVYFVISANAYDLIDYNIK